MEVLPFQIGNRVRDLETAMAQLSEAFGVRWTPPADLRSDGWDIRVVFSREDPPFLELVEGPEGSPWYV